MKPILFSIAAAALALASFSALAQTGAPDTLTGKPTVVCESASASTTAYTCPVALVASYLTTLVVNWVPDRANSTTTPTLDLGPGAKTIVDANGIALAVNSIVVGTRYRLTYDGVNLRILNRITGAQYTLTIGGSSFSPADATTYYAGWPLALAPTTTANIRRVLVPQPGSVRTVCFSFANNSILGTAETSSVFLRLNNATDTTLSTAVTNDVMPTTYCTTGLAVPVVVGDSLELKWTTPTWATNPSNLHITGVVYIQ